MDSLNQRLPATDSGFDVASQHHNFSLRANKFCRELQKQAASSWYVGPSEIAGQGIFADKEFEPGETIGLAMSDGGKDEFESKNWNLTLLARYCNHQSNANAAIADTGDSFDLVATAPIGKDEEIVADYRQVSKAIGRNARMLWQGTQVPSTDLSDYTEKTT
jgi:hypothetical protein